jgi:uncharacterized membrane protein YvlD (DUF360 family)
MVGASWVSSWLVGALTQRNRAGRHFAISGFFSALLASLVVSLVSWMASWYVGPTGQIEIITARR